MSHAIIIFFVLTLATCALSNNPTRISVVDRHKSTTDLPGVKVTLLQSGVTYLKNIFEPIIIQQFKDVSLPDINQEIDSPIGHLDFHVTQLHMNDFKINDVGVELVAQQGLRATVKNAFASVSGNWNYRKKHFPHLKDHGSMTVNVGSNVVFLLTGKVVPSGNSTTIDVTVPQFNIDIYQFDIHLHGGASWLYDLFKKKIEHAVRDAIASTLKSQVSSIVQQEAKSVLSTIDLNFDVTDDMSVDFSFVKLLFQSSFVGFDQLGLFRPKGKPSYPKSPLPMPDVYDARAKTDMIQIFISDFVIDSMGFAIDQLDWLDVMITNDKLPEWFFIRLSTKAMCFFVPKLCELYPESKDMQIQITLGESPTASFDSHHALVSMNMDATFQVLNDSSVDTVFVLDLGTILDAKPDLVNQSVIVASLTYINSTLSLKESKVGSIDLNNMEYVMSELLKLFIIPMANEAAQKGFPLPTVQGVEIKDPFLDIGKDFMIVSSKFTYKPHDADSNIRIV